MIFYAKGQNDPQECKYFGVIRDATEQDITVDIIKTIEVRYKYIYENVKLHLGESLVNEKFKNDDTGGNFIPYQVSGYIFEQMLKACLPVLNHHNIVFNDASKKKIIYEKFKNDDLGSKYGPYHVEESFFEQILKACLPVLNHHNIVFNGAPGTGKTYLAKQIARMLDAEMKFVQFHPSYDYTDFVEGLRPVVNTDNNTIGFERRDGHFKDFCAEAAENMAASRGKKIDWENGTLVERTEGEEELRKFVFIIDEINRGDMSKIFGELFYSIECGYRVSADKLEDAIRENSEYTVQTQYQNLIKDSKNPKEKHYFQNGFFVPDNIYIIGTMNDIDRSVESMDFAMRRRFTFIEITPEEAKGMLYGKLTPELAGRTVEKMDAINKIISEEIGSEYQIGPAYFLDLKDDSDFNSLWIQRIEPLIKEYRRGEDKDDNENLFVKLKKMWDNPASEK